MCKLVKNLVITIMETNKDEGMFVYTKKQIKKMKEEVATQLENLSTNVENDEAIEAITQIIVQREYDNFKHDFIAIFVLLCAIVFKHRGGRRGR